MNVLAYGSRPIGAALGALIASVVGVESCLAVSTAAFLWQAAVILRSPVVALKTQPTSLHSSPATSGVR